MPFTYFSQKKILYVHGFGSSGATHTAVLLQQLLPEAEVLHPDIPIEPAEQLPFLLSYVEAHRPDLVIGTSMGAMLTEKLRGYDRICVNPALHIDQSIGTSIKYGEQAVQNPRADGVTSVNVTKALAKAFGAVCAHNFEGLTPDDADRVAGLFGREDPVVNCYEEFRAHYPRSIRFDGAHRLTDHVLLHSVMPVVRFFHLRQEGIEPAAVAVRIETLRREDGLQTSGARIAFERLAEDYDLYVIATPEEERETGVTAWLEENIGVPAWHKVILTDHVERVMADYLVTPFATDAERFLGTALEYGTPKFKTWEALTDYFSLLGGQ